jgi:predicted nucleic acid-binding protein
MRDSVVADASVIAKFYFPEVDSESARALLTSGVGIVVPDFLFIELASVAAKYVRRGWSSDQRAEDALSSLGELIDQSVPMPLLARRAFHFAARHGFSAYDGAYMALAEMEGLVMVTADERLLRRAIDAGLGRLVRLLGA